MYVPKWLCQLLLAAGAVALGWIAKDALGGIAPGSAESTASVTSEDRTDELVDALSALARDRQEPTAAPVELTIVLDDGGAPAPAPSQSGASQDGASPDGAVAALGGSAAPVHRGAGTATMSPTPSRPLGGHDRARHETDSGIVAGSGGRAVSGSPTFGSPSTAATGGPPSWRAMFHESAPATAPRPPKSPTALGLPTGDALSLYLSPQTATAAIGEHIVIAYDDSIVLVGDNGRLTGNTGDAGQGGVVALDAQSSSFSTESATRAAPVTVAGGGGMTALSAGTGGGANAGAMGGGGGVTGGFVPNAAPGVVSPLIPPMVSLGHDRAVDIAGYEDHSLSVRGQRNIVTYDDPTCSSTGTAGSTRTPATSTPGGSTP